MKRISFFRVAFLYFLFMLEANLIHPITPALFQAKQFPSYMFGAAFAAMALTGGIFSPFWGQLGDRIGHEKVFAIGCIGYGLWQYLFYIADTVPFTLAARLLCGTTCNSVLVAGQSYVTLGSKPEDRAKNLSLLAAAECVGTCTGFLVGGLLGDVSLDLPFLVQIPFTVTVGLLALLLLGNVRLPGAADKPFDLKKLNPVSSFISIRDLLDRPLILYFIFVACFFAGHYCLDQNFNYYIRDIFAFPTSYNGAIKAAIGILGLAANLTLNQWINRHADHRLAASLLYGLYGVFLLIAPLSASVKLFILLCGGAYLCHATVLPVQQTLVIQNAEGSGSAFGAYNATRMFGMVIGALYAGFTYDVNPKLPFFSAGVIMLVTAGLALWDKKLYADKESAGTAR